MKFFSILSILSALLIGQSSTAETLVTKKDENVISAYALSGGHSEILKIVSQKMFERILLREGYSAVHVGRVGLSTFDYINLNRDETWMRTEGVSLKKCEPEKIENEKYATAEALKNGIESEEDLKNLWAGFTSDVKSIGSTKRHEAFSKCHDPVGSCWVKISLTDKLRQIYLVELDKGTCGIVDRAGRNNVSVDIEKTGPSTFDLGEIVVK